MTVMENYVSEQLILFLRAIGLGICLGLLYDLLGELRGIGGKLWGGILDAGFCLTAAVSVLFFVLAGDGELRIFMALGIIGGAVLFWCLLGGILRPVWAFWLGLVLLPVHLADRFLKKCGRKGKKVFSFCENWVTMKITSLQGRRQPPQQEGDMGKPSGKKKTPRKKRSTNTRPSGKLTLLLLAALLVGLGVQIYSMFGQLQDARAEEAVYAQRLSELRETNEQLKEDLDNSGDQTLIEDIARDQLGMVSPGEKVFHFSK